MKYYLTTYLFIFFFNPSLLLAQPGTWTWLSGDSTKNNLANFGIQGVSSSTNKPAALYSYIGWKSKDNKFWIYGGMNTSLQPWADLWKYDPLINEWTWVWGPGVITNAINYGSLGVSSPTNSPGSRFYGCPSWVDTSGNFWLFGGGSPTGYRNDLWKFDLSLGEWTWVSGTNLANQNGVYGTLGIPSINNVPTARDETTACWTDSLNNLWFFGGYNDNGSYNDLWKYDISTNEWTWISGANSYGQPGNYGMKGIPNATNVPGARRTYSNWKDSSGNFYFLGGLEQVTGFVNRNDVWKFDPSTYQWTWISGTNVPNDVGIMGAKCTPGTNYIPSSRFEIRSNWVDSKGTFWLFGGIKTVTNTSDFYSDLWKFDLSNNEWAWVSGDSIPNQAGNYGVKNIPGFFNIPSPRAGAICWTDSLDNLFLFGGTEAVNLSIINNDVWKYEPDNCIGSSLAPIINIASSDTNWCEKSCIDFFDLSTNSPTSWQWYFSGGLPDTSTLQNPTGICYNAYGSYDVKLIACNNFGCDSIEFLNFINEFHSPPAPSISASNDTLFSSPASSYEWYELGNLSLVLSTDSFYVTNQPGSYFVIAYDSLGCGTPSTIWVVQSINELMLGNNSFSIMPNPSSGNLSLIVNGIITDRIQYIVYDALGQIIKSSYFDNGDSKIELNIASKGIYILEIRINNRSIRTKVFVN